MPAHPALPRRAEEAARFIQRHPPQVVLRALSLRLAKQCRAIVQGCLREEEWRDCDDEFYRVIHTGLTEWLAAMQASQQPVMAEGAPQTETGEAGSLAIRTSE